MFKSLRKDLTHLTGKFTLTSIPQALETDTLYTATCKQDISSDENLFCNQNLDCFICGEREGGSRNINIHRSYTATDSKFKYEPTEIIFRERGPAITAPATLRDKIRYLQLHITY